MMASAFLPNGPLAGLEFVQALIIATLLAVAVTIAARKDWALSVRRALFFFLLLSLLVLVASLLPEEMLAAARPGLLIAARILGFVG